MELRKALVIQLIWKLGKEWKRVSGNDNSIWPVPFRGIITKLPSPHKSHSLSGRNQIGTPTPSLIYCQSPDALDYVACNKVAITCVSSKHQLTHSISEKLRPPKPKRAVHGESKELIHPRSRAQRRADGIETETEDILRGKTETTKRPSHGS